MAAQALIPEDELRCSVCSDIFKEPVVLKCSHSFCRVCLQRYWKEKGSQNCPICRRKTFSVEEPPVNLVLRSIVESYLKQKTDKETAHKSEARCSLHGEKLLLFCKHDKETLCLVCHTSKKHTNHPVCPVEEAVLDLKEELKPALNLIKEKLKIFTKNERECKKTAEHMRSQTQHTERQIKADFKRLHQFLREEEEARLAVLKEEGEVKSRVMEEKLADITRHISTLTDKITTIQKAMDTEDTSFLKVGASFTDSVLGLSCSSHIEMLTVKQSISGQFQ
ncbi:E3 ubiquitin-protein ligase TRIM35-like [Conger conger]|uniref:E3 ubiquitin-protein ligase TRIM35-like n=1 Tax=Conger conger TaxID=82655 RepID=UPI002A5A4AEC|nr:E3 ubiquitin-protein ligase TRIM35-like [Conger conger]